MFLMSKHWMYHANSLHKLACELTNSPKIHDHVLCAKEKKIQTELWRWRTFLHFPLKGDFFFERADEQARKLNEE